MSLRAIRIQNLRKRPRLAAFTLVETMAGAALVAGILAGALAGIVALQKSFGGYKQYAAKSNDGSRLIDYLSRDLRNAVAVSRRDSGVVTAFKTGALEINEATQLVVCLPNYYASNVPDNTSNSSYKTGKFSRSALPTGSSYFVYDSAVAVIGTTRVPNYPGGFVEARYSRKTRSATDPTLCYVRQEYDGSPAALRLEQEVAERVDTEKITIQAMAPRRFRVVTSFAPRWTGEAKRAGTVQFSQVSLLNQRQD